MAEKHDLQTLDASIIETGLLLGSQGDKSLETASVQDKIYLADAQLVAQAYRLAMGYETVDESTEYVNNPKYNEVNGQRIDKWVPGKKTVTKRQYKPDNSALKLLLQARYPKDFAQTKKVKKSNKSDTVEGQVLTSASRLLEEMRKKEVKLKETA